MGTPKRKRRGLAIVILLYYADFVNWNLNRRTAMKTVLLLLSRLFPGASSAADAPHSLERIRQKRKVPGLAVIVFKDGKICERSAVGVRKMGDPELLTTEDQFHIGSCTKSMTATLAAILIEKGKLTWTTTIGEVFPDLKGKMDVQYEAVTLEQLLTHRGGAPGKQPETAWEEAFKEKGTPVEQRRKFIEAVLKEPPEASPGTKFIYSNQGYAIAGAILEKIVGEPWEKLMEERVFTPLKMSSAGFGPPGEAGKVDQPWGHQLVKGNIAPLRMDNPPAIAPAGRVHCSLDDLMRYVVMHSHGAKEGGLLKPETFRKLHTPPHGQEYAFGWIEAEADWAGGKAYTHTGSNTMWMVTIWFAPANDFAVVAATNIGGNKAEKACDEVVSEMITKWVKK